MEKTNLKINNLFSMNPTQQWLLKRLQDHNEFGDNIKDVKICGDTLLINTFIKGFINLLDDYVMYQYGYYEDQGNGWNSPQFIRTNKMFVMTIKQIEETYKYFYGGSRFTYNLYTHKYEIGTYGTYQFMAYIEYGIPYDKWFHFLDHNCNQFINMLRGGVIDEQSR